MKNSTKLLLLIGFVVILCGAAYLMYLATIKDQKPYQIQPEVKGKMHRFNPNEK